MNRLALMVIRNLTKVPGLWSKLQRYARHPENYSEEEKWGHIQHIMQLAVKAGNVELCVSGQKNLPAEGGFMMYANHQGMFDVVAIAATCHRPLSVVLKKELANVPLIKQIIAMTNSFPMDREDVRQSLEVIRAVTEQVEAGRRYLIFPEGTRSRKGNEMEEFHGGSFRCAVKAKCPIVPVAFVDSFRVLDEKGSAPVKVSMRYLEPIAYEEFAGMKAAQVAELVKQRIRTAMDEMTEKG